MTDFEKELIHYIFYVQDADDDNLSAEVICRKLYKYGLIDRGRGYWRPKKRPKYRWPARAIRKAEQTENSSEIPNNYEPKICDFCRYYNSNIPCGSTPSACKEADKFAEEFVDGLKKLKPTISKMEQVDETRLTAKCLNCANGSSYKCSKCDGEMYYKYDKAEPQTDGYMTAEQAEDYRKMLDKAEHKVYGNIEDEPQTEDTCKECVNKTDCPWR